MQTDNLLFWVRFYFVFGEVQDFFILESLR